MRLSVRNVCLALGLVGAAVLVAAGPARAQQPDTARAAPADSLVAPAGDSLAGPADPPAPRRREGRAQDRPERVRPAALPPAVYGRPVVDSLPARLPRAGLEHFLAERPGSFLYDLGAVGWPHGWAVDGLAPHRARLWLDGRPYTDPLTGRPRYDLLPPSFLKPPRVGADPGGAAVGVHVDWRDYLVRVPITEIRFQRDSNGLQAAEVAHSQQRRFDLFGVPGIFQATAGYGGRATGGAYTGSDLRRERRLWARLRYRTDDWSLAISDFSARHRLGTHGGVVPPVDGVFRSVYALPLAESSVNNPEAQRLTYRNDLTARLQVPLFGPLLPGRQPPTTLTGTWIVNTFSFDPDYPSRPDTTWAVRTQGLHAAARQRLRVGGHALTLGAAANTRSADRSNVGPVTGRRWRAHLYARDSLGLPGGAALELDAGWHAGSGGTHPSARARLEGRAGGLGVFAEASLSGQALAWLDDAGWPVGDGPGFVRPLEGDAPGPRELVGRASAGLSLSAGTVDLSLRGVASEVRRPVERYAVTPETGRPPAVTDTFAVRRARAPFRRVGATATLGWRRDARRGIYLRGRATAQRLLTRGRSTLHRRVARTLPNLAGRLRLGARFVFFEDLITDLYVQARGWSAMNSRWFHPPTGLFVVPPAASPVPDRPGTAVGPSGTVDVHAEAILFGAKLFFTFENVQAGTELQPGVFTVPVYPLPGRAFRFGVHWPIFN